MPFKGEAQKGLRKARSSGLWWAIPHPDSNWGSFFFPSLGRIHLPWVQIPAVSTSTAELLILTPFEVGEERVVGMIYSPLKDLQRNEWSLWTKRICLWRKAGYRRYLLRKVNPTLQAWGSGSSASGPASLWGCSNCSAAAPRGKGGSGPLGFPLVDEKLNSSATATLLTSWESQFRSTLFGVINLSLIKGCQLCWTLSQYNDLPLLHKCQVKAGTYFQGRRHLSCDSVILKWLTPAAPNGGCKLSGAGAADWKLPPAHSLLLQRCRDTGAAPGGCFTSKSKKIPWWASSTRCCCLWTGSPLWAASKGGRT